MYYLTDFCSLCLESNKNVTSQTSIDLNARVILEYVIPESVLQKSEIPIQICENCLNNINNFFKFKQKCLENIISLSEFVQKLIEEHGPYKYLSVTINEISLRKKGEMSIENHTNVGNSEEPKCEVRIKTEILENIKNNSAESQNENGMENIEQLLIKVENSVDNLYVKEEINEELIIKDDSDLFESNIEDSLNTEYSTLDQNRSGIAASSDINDANDTQSKYTPDDFGWKDQILPNSEFVNTHTDTPEKPIKCEICLKSFPTPTGLKRHKRFHFDDDPYVCYICQKPFSGRDALRSHRRTHLGERPFACENCPKSFAGLVSLRNHEKIHKKVKTVFPCDTCGKICNRSDSLKIHKRSHSDDRPFLCDVCQRTFRQRHALKSHKRIVHNGEIPYECNICQRAYRHLKTLKKHKMTH